MTEASRVQKMLNEQNAEIDKLKNRIERLETALQHARDFAAWMCHWPDSIPCAPNINMYDAALEGEKDER